MSWWRTLLKTIGIVASEPPDLQDDSPSAPSAPAAPPAAGPHSEPVNPYEATGVMGLGPAEMREQLAGAGRMSWYESRWSGIPPAHLPRTQLVDRALVLAGSLTEPQLVEIHRVGELYLKHNQAKLWARHQGEAAGQAAVREARARAAARKERLRAEAAATREARATAVAHRHRTDILFLGRGVSGQLSDRRVEVEALTARGLPVLATPADVAEALGIDVPTLRWLAWHAEAVKTDHYVHFEVPKRSGGERTLSAPMPRLAAAQQWVLANVLVPLPTEEPAHGFVRGRSTVTNARPHVGRDIVVNLDLKDFFPTITFPRVRGVFRRLGYSPAAASVLALLCTACTRREVSLEGEVWRVAVGNRALPQGACTSPALSNQVARRLDRRLQGLCRKLGWAYTRYADDLTFSAPAGHQSEVGGLLRSVQRLVEDEGFALNPAKGRVQRRSGRQSVTGVSVNDQLGLPRKDLRQLRALLHNAKSTGLAAQNRAGVPDFEAHIMGRIGYLAMIDSEKARPFWDAFLAVRGS